VCAFSTLLTFAPMVQEQQWINLLMPWRSKGSGPSFASSPCLYRYDAQFRNFLIIRLSFKKAVKVFNFMKSTLP